MNWQVDSHSDKVSATSRSLELDTSPPRYPKRKREQVTYDECDTVEYASGYSDDDQAPIKKKAMTSKRTKPLPNHKIFPFMKLPPELRNRIYEECLLGDIPIYITNRLKLYRRVAKRDLQWNPNRRRPYEWYDDDDSISHPSDNTDRAKQPNAKSLVPVILAVSKTIYDEAVAILYSQRIIIRDNRVLLDFMAGLTPRCAALLRDIRIDSWCSSISHRSVNLPAMALLAARGATNLTSLNLNCSLGYFRTWSYQPRSKTTPITKRVARKVFRDCFHWLIAVGEAKGNLYAALDVLKVSERNFADYGDARNEENNKRLMEKAEAEMKQHLKILLDRM